MIADILYPYQSEITPTLISRRRQGLFDDPGSGKTIMILAALEADGLFDADRPARSLILATKTGSAVTWMREIRKLVPPHVTVVEAHDGLLSRRRESVSQTQSLTGPVLVVANHAFIELSKGFERSGMWNITWDAIVIDESHKVLPLKSHAEKDITQFWRGLKQLRSHHLTLRFALSGTPDRGKLENRYGTWCFLLPERYNANYPWEDWLRREFAVGFKRFPARNKVGYVEQIYGKYLKDPEDWNKLESVLTIRRTKAEIAPQLPAKRYIDVENPLSAFMQKNYDAYLHEWENYDDSEEFKKHLAIRETQFAICGWQVTGNEWAKQDARPIAGSDSWKRDWILDWLDQRSANGKLDGKVVIASTLSEVLNWLLGELSANGYHSARKLDGGLSTKQRVEVQNEFQRGDLQILLLNTSLGDSIDLDAADDMIFVNEAQDPDINTQTEDRVHRVSRVHQVIIWRLRSIGTIDMRHAALSNRRFEQTRDVYDGRRGVDYSRKIAAKLRNT